MPEQATAALADGNLALLGSSLFLVDSRATDDGQAAAWMIDIHGRAPTSLALGLPARSNASLVLSTDRGALLLVGGVDTTGEPHDDVWSVSLPMGGSWPAASRVRLDSSTPSRGTSNGTVVASTSDGTSVRAWSLGTEEGSGIIAPLVRKDRGWLELDEQGLPVSRNARKETSLEGSCAESHVRGGQHPELWMAPLLAPH